MEPDQQYDVAPDHEASPTTEETLRDRLASLDAGEPGIPAEQVLAEIRDRLAEMIHKPDAERGDK